MKTRGFTLIEIIVCIAIVMTLAAIMLSALKSSVSAAKSTVCINNLGQVHKAVMLYHSDFDEYPPDFVRGPALRPYFGSWAPQCPMRREAQPNTPEPLVVDYFLHMLLDPRLVPEFGPARECRDRRGPDFPLAHDTNHVATRAAYQAGQRFYLFVRADGSVHRVPEAKLAGFALNPSAYPCPSAPYWANF